MLAIQNQKTLVSQEISVTQKMSKAKPRPPTLSNSLKVKAGPTAMHKALKQNLHKIVIFENNPRPAARDRSQSTASGGCKIFYNCQYYNQHGRSIVLGCHCADLCKTSSHVSVFVVITTCSKNAKPYKFNLFMHPDQAQNTLSGIQKLITRN